MQEQQTNHKFSYGVAGGMLIGGIVGSSLAILANSSHKRDEAIRKAQKMFSWSKEQMEKIKKELRDLKDTGVNAESRIENTIDPYD